MPQILSPSAHVDMDALTAQAAANNTPLARLARGETVDPLTLSDEDFEALFPAALVQSVLQDMARRVAQHMGHIQ